MTNVTNHKAFQPFEDSLEELPNTRNALSNIFKDTDWDEDNSCSQDEVISQLGFTKGYSHDYA